uniref:Putative secreted protein n=1 Tax=Anopheles darlingi TaxID=43151 RepID=A0A2M4DAJ4_ANODA
MLILVLKIHCSFGEVTMTKPNVITCCLPQDETKHRFLGKQNCLAYCWDLAIERCIQMKSGILAETLL